MTPTRPLRTRPTDSLARATAWTWLVTALALAAPALATTTTGTATERQVEATRISEDAAARRKQSDFKGCAERYSHAFAVDPAEPLYRYGEGRCAELHAAALEQRGAHSDDVLEWYERADRSFDAFLTGSAHRKNLDPVFVTEARKSRQAIALAVHTIRSRPVPPARPAPPPLAPDRSGVWLMVGGGAALATGIGLLASSAMAGDRARELRGGPRASDIAMYEDRRDLHFGVGVGATALGVALGAAGVWLQLRQPIAAAWRLHATPQRGGWVVWWTAQ